MENIIDFNIAILIPVFVKYIFWIIIYAVEIVVCIIGWKRNKNRGFIFISISGCLSLAYHLPSIVFKGYFAAQRYSPGEFGEIMTVYSYIDFFTMPLIAILMLIGLFYLAFKKEVINEIDK